MDKLPPEVLLCLLQAAQGVSIQTLLSLSSTNRAFRQIYTSSRSRFPIFKAYETFPSTKLLRLALITAPCIHPAPKLSPFLVGEPERRPELLEFFYSNLDRVIKNDVHVTDVQRAIAAHPYVVDLAKLMRAIHDTLLWGEIEQEDRDTHTADVIDIDEWIKSVYFHLAFGSDFVGNSLLLGLTGELFPMVRDEYDPLQLLFPGNIKQTVRDHLTELSEEEAVIKAWIVANYSTLPGGMVEFYPTIQRCIAEHMVMAEHWEFLGRYLCAWGEGSEFIREVSFLKLRKNTSYDFDDLAEKNEAWVQERKAGRIESVKDWLFDEEITRTLKERVLLWERLAQTHN